MNDNNLKVRRIIESDINFLVSIHCASFENFFLTQLGLKFLEIYYSSVIKSDKGIILGCFDNNELVGFCAATTLSAGFHKGLIKTNFVAFLLQGIKILLTKPKALIRLFKNLSKEKDDFEDNGKYAELLSIATLPEKQGSGIGKKLLLQLDNELIENACKEVSLTTDFDNNLNAIEFYKSIGYSVKYEFTTYPNRKMYRLIKQLQ